MPPLIREQIDFAKQPTPIARIALSGCAATIALFAAGIAAPAAAPTHAETRKAETRKAKPREAKPGDARPAEPGKHPAESPETKKADPEADDTRSMLEVIATLPSIEQLENYRPRVASRIFAADGELIGRFGINRTFVPYEKIPKRVVDAFVAAEDQRFFEHDGVDPMALARAAVTNIVGDDLVGGSTITQQVAKTFMLSSDRTMRRKIKEMLLAARIEEALSKERILELYLNQIYLGEGAYGVAAAARTYFDASLDELTVAQAAMLAALPKAPSRTNPIEDPVEAMKRRDYVIERMREDGRITNAEARAAKAAPYSLPTGGRNISDSTRYFVETVRRSMLKRYGAKRWKEGGFSVQTSLDRELQEHATRTLRDGLVTVDRRHGYRGPVANLAETDGNAWKKDWAAALGAVDRPAGANAEWRLAAVLEVGRREATIGFADGSKGRIPLAELKWARKQGKVRVGDTHALEPVGNRIGRVSQVLSPGDVILAEARATDAKGRDYPDGTYTLRQVPKVTGALVAMDPVTGRVVAMVGGYSFDRSQFNMATQARRQPGSAFKPFVFLAALENGYTPSTLVRDAPVSLRTPENTWYTPVNYDRKFHGPMTMRRALELSRNVATVRLSQRVGLDNIASTAERLGVVEQGRRRVLSLALGAWETTPLRMAAGYAAIANGGLRVSPTMIDTIRNRKGRTLFGGERRACEGCLADRTGGAIRPAGTGAARQRAVTAQSAYQLTQMMRGVIQRGTGRVIASLDKPLAGKTGTTNDMVDAWFVGFSPGLVVAVWVGHQDRTSLGRNEQGGVTAAPIFKAFMKKALDGRTGEAFERPGGLRPVTVSLGSGLPREHGRVITEYFKPGQEPTRRGAYAPDGGQVARGNDRRRPRSEAEDGRDVDLRDDVEVVRGDRDRRQRRDRGRRTRDWVEAQDRQRNLYGR